MREKPSQRPLQRAELLYRGAQVRILKEVTIEGRVLLKRAWRESGTIDSVNTGTRERKTHYTVLRAKELARPGVVSTREPRSRPLYHFQRFYLPHSYTETAPGRYDLPKSTGIALLHAPHATPCYDLRASLHRTPYDLAPY